MDYSIKKCEIQDAKKYTDHTLYHMKEKAIGGSYAHPFSSTHIWNREEFLSNLIKKWSLEPFTPNYEIAWGAFIDGKLIGHINLRCGGIEALKHRMRLGMGIETPYRSLGIGKSLFNTALKWAQEQKEVAWIDLSVFSSNLVAQKLYLKNGFKITHRIEDALRIDGESINDIQMVLKI
jgi:RimJ/RimL family protein N-acetyltransferase